MNLECSAVTASTVASRRDRHAVVNRELLKEIRKFNMNARQAGEASYSVRRHLDCSIWCRRAPARQSASVVRIRICCRLLTAWCGPLNGHKDSGGKFISSLNKPNAMITKSFC